MVIGMLAVLTIAGSTMMFYTTSNAKNVVRSKLDETSFSLSEAALNNAMSVLSNPVNNSLDSDVLPSTEATASSVAYENGTAKWYGTLDRAAAVWTITALGIYDNPTGPGTAQVRRKLTAKVPDLPDAHPAVEQPGLGLHVLHGDRQHLRPDDEQQRRRQRADVRRGQPLHREQRRHGALGAASSTAISTSRTTRMSVQARAWPRVSRRMWAATAGTAAARGPHAAAIRTRVTSTASSPTGPRSGSPTRPP